MFLILFFFAFSLIAQKPTSTPQKPIYILQKTTYQTKKNTKDDKSIKNTTILPGITWSIETATGVMTFSHLKNDYGKEIDLPYDSLAFSSATLFVDMKNVFDTRTTVTLGFVTKPFNMSWTQGPEFFDETRAVEIDFKILPEMYLYGLHKSPLRPFAGYNYQNFLVDKFSNGQAFSYYGNHSIVFGVDFMKFMNVWLRLNGYFGIAPITISGTVTTNPYICYGGSIFFFLWRLKVGLTYSAKKSPNNLSRNKTYDFEESAFGVSIWVKL